MISYTDQSIWGGDCITIKQELHNHHRENLLSYDTDYGQDYQ